MTDPRERRRQRAAANKESFDLLATLRKFMVPIIIVIIAGGLIGFQVAQAEGVFGKDEGCPGHWHAGYSVWDGDEKVRFNPNGPAGNAQGSPGAGFHIHGDDGILHFHPAAPRCIAVEDAFEKMGVQVAQDSLTIFGEERLANETAEVVVYHKPWGEGWQRVSNVDSFMGKQPGNGDQIMVAYMSQDSAISIEDRQAQTTDLAGGNYEPGEESAYGDEFFINITMTVIFSLLAIILWYNFVKKTW